MHSDYTVQCHNWKHTILQFLSVIMYLTHKHNVFEIINMHIICARNKQRKSKFLCGNTAGTEDQEITRFQFQDHHDLTVCVCVCVCDNISIYF